MSRKWHRFSHRLNPCQLYRERVCVRTYRHSKLVVFYNETLGILPHDDLPRRILKLRLFLTDF